MSACSGGGERQIWDISQKLGPLTPMWPGDVTFTSGTSWDHAPGSPVKVSWLRFSTHAGTHADAPLHYDPHGAAIDGVGLAAYLGPARVIDCTAAAAGGLVTAAMLELALSGAPPRILLRTFAQFPHSVWPEVFTAVSADAIALLAAQGTVLIGTDTPSLDPQDSKTMDAHLAVRDAGMRVLEGLVLDAVPPGDYELIALPLALDGMDSAPVRAVLRALI